MTRKYRRKRGKGEIVRRERQRNSSAATFVCVQKVVVVAVVSARKEG